MEALQIRMCGKVLGCPGLHPVALALEQRCVGGWLLLSRRAVRAAFGLETSMSHRRLPAPRGQVFSLAVATPARVGAFQVP